MKSRSGYSIWYEFEYEGYKEDFSYDIPFEVMCNAIRKYFDDNMVNLDGTDTDIWNTIVTFGSDALDTIFEEEEDWLKEQCENEAFEEFKDYVEYYIKDDE